MANEQNLKRINSEKMAREYQKKSVESRNKNTAERKDLRKAIEILLEKTVSKDKDGKEISGAEAMALKQFEKALKGDTRAFEVIRDTAGQKPVEKVEMATIDQSVIDEVERMVFKDDDTATSN
jgi:hypothetical protein